MSVSVSRLSNVLKLSKICQVRLRTKFMLNISKLRNTFEIKLLYTTSVRNMFHNVFVYGTLKRNEPNHHWLANRENGTCKYISEGITKTKYPLIIATRYNIPFLLYSPGDGHNVKGEIYQIDDNMLSKLDILEDHPSYYVRELDAINIKKAGSEEVTEMKCWVYFLKKFKPELLTRPLLETYSSKGGHGLPYMERSKRDPNYNYKPEVTG